MNYLQVIAKGQNQENQFSRKRPDIFRFIQFSPSGHA